MAKNKTNSFFKRQDHLIHILVLAVFIALLVFFRAQDFTGEPVVVLVLASVYLIINIGTDYKAKMLSSDTVLEYFAIAVLASVVVLSF